MVKENKRYKVFSDMSLDLYLKDTLTKKYIISMSCKDLLEFKTSLQSFENCCKELNRLYEQNKMFKNHNQQLINENEKLKAKINLTANAMIKFDEFFYTKIYEPSDAFDFSEFSNRLFKEDEE